MDKEIKIAPELSGVTVEQSLGITTAQMIEDSDALQDMLSDARQDLSDLYEALRIPYEPHQTLRERALQQARRLASIDRNKPCDCHDKK